MVGCKRIRKTAKTYGIEHVRGGTEGNKGTLLEWSVPCPRFGRHIYGLKVNNNHLLDFSIIITIKVITVGNIMQGQRTFPSKRKDTCSDRK
jgi:hypothetical protein